MTMHFREAVKRNYRQLLFVFTAFLAMALTSCFYVGSLMKKQIDLFSRSEMQVYKLTLRALILAHEAALQHTAAVAVTAMERGAGPDELRNILSALTEVFTKQKNIGGLFVSVYGYLDGNYLDGAGWIPGEFFNPKTANWLKGAAAGNGIFHSKPYIDARTGHAVSSVSMLVLDGRGRNRGVLAVDYLLNPITERVGAYKLADNGYGLLLDDSFNVLIAPDGGWIGRQVDDLPGFSGLKENLVRLDDQAAIESVDLGRFGNIGFFSRLENGWYLGLVAPLRYYYREVFNLMPAIFALALALAGVLSFILLRLSAARLRSEEENRFKSSFLARMSHEIRTPLNAIIGMSELARRHYARKQGLEYIGEIRRAGANLLSIVNDILDLSKIESGRLQLESAPYQAAAIFDDILAIVKIHLGDKPLELFVDIAPDIPAAMLGDEGRIRQLVLNLLSNAVKYTPKGFVRFKAESLAAGEEQVRLFFTVEDSGPGLKPEQLELIFSDFVRLERSGPQRIEGAGLGLPIARAFCRAMGGDISVSSEFGRGATFRAEIRQKIVDPSPLGAFEMGRPRPDEGRNEGAPFTAPGFRVLVIDDVATNLVVAEGFLALYQVDVTTCLSGREAVEAARREDFDLIFIDHMMPEMDGLETLKALRETNLTLGNVPAVALTANALSGMREMFLAAGFDDYLPKPITIKSLSDLMIRRVPPDRRKKPGLKTGVPASSVRP
ncbi:MAG: response regulator [Candidatus Adiutrix sp.]|jgi:signal transduction histidine kinase/ActR/RegA family two-component response regulator|nr:response regulator [Candidatus Adiutrix sp.]